MNTNSANNNTTENLTINYPEMWGNTNDAIQAEYRVLLNKYRVTTPKEIKLLRGIEAKGIVEEFGANNVKNKRAGYFVYYMTINAFEKFVKTNKVTQNIDLD